ncbi:beta-lactamase/transpeptidase-like protein [Lizonia empirigonia]|nr:beta-lactamase/transpeptidase-like protein [Lizonia empirigonia]
MWSYFFVALKFSRLPLSFAIPNCPIYGAEFPPPQRLAQHPKWQQALANLTLSFDYIDANDTGKSMSYSVQVFSTNPGNAILAERHRTAPNLLPDTEGVKQVNGDTVYRLGSVSKIFTILAFLAEVGDIYWNQPITRFIPELAQYSQLVSTRDLDDVRRTDWDDITIGALAAQVSGIGRDCSSQTEFWERYYKRKISQYRGKFFTGIELMFPSYLPWQTASYSDIGYQLLSYALESISGKTFVDVLNDRVIEPLGLKHTYFENAPPSVGIIPTTTKDDFWWVNLGDANPGGNMYSSANDVSTLGYAILSSKLIKPSLTRRWLNPVTFSADFAAAVGAPWGVRRIQLDPFVQPYRSLSVFTKAGTFRAYTAFLTLLKEFNLGFTILTAGSSSVNNFMVADMLGASLIPAYDAAARDEADQIYGGIYVGAGTSAMPNSSLVITTDPSKPGLGIVAWTSNGTDMIKTAGQLQSGSNSTALRTEARLYYTQLETKAKSGQMRQSWKAVFEDTGLPSAPGPMLFSTGCGAWVGLTGVTYGSLPLDEFVFDFNSDGKVVSVTNLALRSTLYKVDVYQSADLLPALCEKICPLLVQT